MALNGTPSGERKHIVLIGMRNAGKSSLMNSIIGQELAVVSPVKGTTTDPVRKAMELLPAGPVLFIDTPGIDDEGDLGRKRSEKAQLALERADGVLIAVDGMEPFPAILDESLKKIRERSVPVIAAITKSDVAGNAEKIENELIKRGFDSSSILSVSSVTGAGIEALKSMLGKVLSESNVERTILGDLLSPGDIVILVIPIDKAAPKGRLILPQQQTIRSILDSSAVAVAVKESELEMILENLKGRVRMVVTDSQIFGKVSEIVPDEIPLTSFSILMARYKGNLDSAVKGAAALSSLRGGERILISEGCTHHRQCGDIGTEKLPMWIRRYTGKDFMFEHTMGTGFPEDLSPYSLVIHCGGCMLTEREMEVRYGKAEEAEIPITNYGTIIAYMNGILERSLSLFPSVLSYLQR